MRKAAYIRPTKRRKMADKKKERELRESYTDRDKIAVRKSKRF